MENIKFKVAGLTLACALASTAYAEVPHTFSNGQVADADQVNENFSDLDDRLSALGQRLNSAADNDTSSITVDCTDDANALRNAVSEGYYEVQVQSGAVCDGNDIYVENRKLRIVGIPDSTPAEITLGSGSAGVLFAKSSYLDLRNIKLVGSAPNSGEAVLFVDGNSYARLTDVQLDCDGGDYALGVRASTARLNNVTIDKCTKEAVFVVDNGYLRVDQGNTITGLGAATLAAARGGSIHVRSKGGNQILNNSTSEESVALGIFKGGSLRIDKASDGADENLVKGGIMVKSVSSAELKGFTWQPDNKGNKFIYSEFGSMVEVKGLDLSASEVEVMNNASLAVYDSPEIQNAEILAEYGGSLLIDSTNVAASSTIEIYFEGILAAENSSNIAADITLGNTGGVGRIASGSTFTGTAVCGYGKYLLGQEDMMNHCVW